MPAMFGLVDGRLALF